MTNAEILFADVSEFGSSVEMTCEWGSNSNAKTVTWLRDSSPMIQWNIAKRMWIFEGDGNTVTRDEAVSSYKDRLEKGEVDSYTTQHKIILYDVVKYDEGFYSCHVQIGTAEYMAPPKDMNIIGN